MRAECANKLVNGNLSARKRHKETQKSPAFVHPCAFLWQLNLLALAAIGLRRLTSAAAVRAWRLPTSTPTTSGVGLSIQTWLTPWLHWRPSITAGIWSRTE